MKKYKYIVSLGHFCSPAMEFDKINKRQFSLPFDWLITPALSTVMELIQNEFPDFLNAEYLFQFQNAAQCYKNTKTNISFYHDFSAFKSLDSQMGEVTQKYNRRIQRFYDIIKEPTLFLRYITQRDIPYILQNYDAILKTLQGFHPQNHIIFVTHFDNRFHDRPEIPVYYVEKNPDDTVCRDFLCANEELKQYILKNVEEATPKPTAPKSNVLDMIRKTFKKVRIKLNLVYHHKNQC